VHEEYKLADFGFAKFEKDEIGKSTTFLLGGTLTYGKSGPKDIDAKLTSQPRSSRM